MASKNESWAPLPREEVIKAIERKGPSRIPLVYAKWWGEGLAEECGERFRRLDRYPTDVGCLWTYPINVDAMGLSWEIQKAETHENSLIIDEWAKLDEFIEKLPDAENDPVFESLAEEAKGLGAQNLYRIFGWWHFFFEQPWMLRGMANLMVDYYEERDNVHRLHSALCDVYCAYLRRAARELKPDGFWTSDDLGHQTQPMMSPALFDEVIKPYYMKVGRVLKEARMHWWVHSCGNNTPLLPALVDAGLNVFHPVQKGTMDEAEVAREWGEKLTFLVGFDVQHILPEGDTEAVRREVRHLIDTFDRPGGGMCMAAGNAIVTGTPFDNIDAFLDESLRYGQEHRQGWAN